MDDYPIVPGRGLVSSTAKELRLDYMKNIGIAVDEISQVVLNSDDIKNNIESNVGSVEIPVGLVGPLLFTKNETKEYVHSVIGTLEGALIASMNRGAKCISMSGGFNAHVLHQKMIRTPMFIFENLNESIAFKAWVEENFYSIKKIAESYSNHAKLDSILTYVIGKSVHLKFVFRTGDASGQNMTTACTWHSVLWIEDHFTKDSGINIVHSIIEGNGASDKKVSQFSINHGRGIHVVAETHLSEEVIHKVLRTTSKEFVRCFNQSVAMSQIDGMVGYNINVANAIAGIFAATGQDLACIHESSCAVLNVEQADNGLYLSLNLPSLVVGTVGGGTHLKKQREALEVMGCFGNNSVNRFAELIAGFALSLEISTFAAIVSGQFAKSHEKLGRNKPVDWITKAEINKGFVQKLMPSLQIERLNVSKDIEVENGIITHLTERVSKKLIGFLPLSIKHKNGTDKVLVKSKPLGTEVVKGLHYMAANIDIELADLIFEHQASLEYTNCHLKEVELYKQIKKLELDITPYLFGSFSNKKRECYLLFLECLEPSKLKLFNSENSPEKWEEKDIKQVITSISKFHNTIQSQKNISTVFEEFKVVKSKPLYEKLIQLMISESESDEERDLNNRLFNFLTDLDNAPSLAKTIVHNDFNPRNIAIRKNGDACIYDWELATLNYPHRDIIELLCFVLSQDVSKEKLYSYLEFHFELRADKNVIWEDWKKGYLYSLKEFMVTRISFYSVGSMLLKYGFVQRVLATSFRIVDLLK
jgi:hydroxymethylglutaryl-CoA reductase (NADPH)